MAKKLAHISEEHSREQTVYEHLTGTAELAKQFAAAFGAEEDGYLEVGLKYPLQHKPHSARRKTAICSVYCTTSASTAMPFSID